LGARVDDQGGNFENLSDGKPKAMREFVVLTGLNDKVVDNVLRGCWKEGQ